MTELKYLRILGVGLLPVLLSMFAADDISAQSPGKKADPAPKSVEKIAAPAVEGTKPTIAAEIAALEKQIAELQAKLAELKAKAEQKPTPIVGTIPEAWTSAFQWRCIGPATMGGRITSIAVDAKDPTVWYLGHSSAGILKTTNHGSSFTHLFDKESTSSVGAVAVAPSNSAIVWVGTGEANPRNSVSWGDGVYKSIDGGKTWKNMGLKESFQIGKIIIHPTNPDIVYVGALGRLYGPNAERGLFKTTDGGKTWNKIFSLDDKTGVIDMVSPPSEPDTIYVAMWERSRDEFDSFLGVPPPPGTDEYGPNKQFSTKAGIYKTTDGGKTFSKLTNGLPTVAIGRIGLDIYAKDPKILYAIVDTEKVGEGAPPLPVYLGVVRAEPEVAGGAKIESVTPDSPAAKAGLKAGDLITAVADSKVADYDDMLNELRSRKPNDKVEFTIQRGQETVKLSVTLGKREEVGQPRPPVIGLRTEESKDGMKVVEVVADSAAAKAGLKVGDLITIFDQQEVRTTEALLSAIRAKKAGDKVSLTYVRGKETKTVEVVLQEPQVRQRPGASRPYSGEIGGQRANVQGQQGKDGFQTGGVFKSIDGGATWKRVNSINPRPMYFSVVRVDPNDDNVVYVLGVSLTVSYDGGKTFASGIKQKGADGKETIVSINGGVHSDHHDLWIDPRDSRHMLLGTDGGLYVTFDRGLRWEHHNHMAMGQFYHVGVDNRKPYRVYGGLQDNGSWGGPSQLAGSNQGPVNSDWVNILGGDGFICLVDPSDPDIVYCESQDGRVVRRNLRTGLTSGYRYPPRKEGEPPYRLNWKTPILISNHNPAIVYVGSQYVFRSLNRGDSSKIISPEITRTKRGSATALSESPKNADVLWVGTDDGAVHVTRDGGTTWTNVTAKIGLKGPRWVASIEASRFEEGRAYVCFDGHRSDDDAPLLYVTEDFGATWKSISSNLPIGSTKVLREDLVNKNLLYVGTEFAVFASINRGESWTKINNNLPTVAVHDFAQPTTASEIVAATHGRSLWVLNVASLRELSAEVVKAEKPTLLTPATMIRFAPKPSRDMGFGLSERRFLGENPDRSPRIEYVLPAGVKKAAVRVLDVTGKEVRNLTAPTDAGLQRARWAGAAPLPGTYKVVLTVDGTEYVKPFTIEGDPNLPIGTVTAGDWESSLEEDEEEGDKEVRPQIDE